MMTHHCRAAHPECHARPARHRARSGPGRTMSAALPVVTAAQLGLPPLPPLLTPRGPRRAHSEALRVACAGPHGDLNAAVAAALAGGGAWMLGPEADTPVSVLASAAPPAGAGTAERAPPSSRLGRVLGRWRARTTAAAAGVVGATAPGGFARCDAAVIVLDVDAPGASATGVSASDEDDGAATRAAPRVLLRGAHLDSYAPQHAWSLPHFLRAAAPWAQVMLLAVTRQQGLRAPFRSPPPSGAATPAASLPSTRPDSDGASVSTLQPMSTAPPRRLPRAGLVTRAFTFSSFGDSPPVNARSPGGAPADDDDEPSSADDGGAASDGGSAGGRDEGGSPAASGGSSDGGGCSRRRARLAGDSDADTDEDAAASGDGGGPLYRGTPRHAELHLAPPSSLELHSARTALVDYVAALGLRGDDAVGELMRAGRLHHELLVLRGGGAVVPTGKASGGRSERGGSGDGGGGGGGLGGDARQLRLALAPLLTRALRKRVDAVGECHVWPPPPPAHGAGGVSGGGDESHPPLDCNSGASPRARAGSSILEALLRPLLSSTGSRGDAATGAAGRGMPPRPPRMPPSSLSLLRVLAHRSPTPSSTPSPCAAAGGSTSGGGGAALRTPTPPAPSSLQQRRSPHRQQAWSLPAPGPDDAALASAAAAATGAASASSSSSGASAQGVGVVGAAAGPPSPGGTLAPPASAPSLTSSESLLALRRPATGHASRREAATLARRRERGWAPLTPCRPLSAGASQPATAAAAAAAPTVVCAASPRAHAPQPPREATEIADARLLGRAADDGGDSPVAPAPARAPAAAGGACVWHTALCGCCWPAPGAVLLRRARPTAS